MQNILFIMMDQLRADCLGFKGKFPVKTPNLDYLAKNGTLFENAYCSSPLCVPARASIMNGKLPMETGCYYNDQGWDDSVRTIASELSTNGYYTVSIGKMHFNPPRKHYGLHKKMVEHNASVYYEDYKKAEKNNKNIDDIRDAIFNTDFTTQPSDIPLEYFEPVVLTDTTLAELNKIVKRRDCHPGGGEPFFLWHSFWGPHTPCDPPEPYFSMYDPDELPDFIEDDNPDNYPASLRRWYDSWEEKVDNDMRRKIRAQYLGLITLLDAQVGRVLNRLRQLGLEKNTLIIFAADHGDYMGDRKMQQKGFMHDQTAKVPLIFSGPGIPKNKRIKENVSTIDIFPTILQYSWIAPALYDPIDNTPSEWQPGNYSRNLIPLFEDKTEAFDDRIVICESGIHGYHVMMRKHDQKYIWYDGDNVVQHFDLSKDPNEIADLALGKQPEKYLPADIMECLKDIQKKINSYRDKTYRFCGKDHMMFT